MITRNQKYGCNLFYNLNNIFRSFILTGYKMSILNKLLRSPALNMYHNIMYETEITFLKIKANTKKTRTEITNRQRRLYTNNKRTGRYSKLATCASLCLTGFSNMASAEQHICVK